MSKKIILIVMYKKVEYASASFIVRTSPSIRKLDFDVVVDNKKYVPYSDKKGLRI